MDYLLTWMVLGLLFRERQKAPEEKQHFEERQKAPFRSFHFR